MYYKPIQEAKNKSRKSVKNKRHKFEYKCAKCNGWFVSKEVQVDHIIPAGALNKAEDLKGFVERLFCEDVNGYQVLCKGCHNNKTNFKSND